MYICRSSLKSNNLFRCAAAAAAAPLAHTLASHLPSPLPPHQVFIGSVRPSVLPSVPPSFLAPLPAPLPVRNLTLSLRTRARDSIVVEPLYSMRIEITHSLTSSAVNFPHLIVLLSPHSKAIPSSQSGSLCELCSDSCVWQCSA